MEALPPLKWLSPIHFNEPPEKSPHALGSLLKSMDRREASSAVTLPAGVAVWQRYFIKTSDFYTFVPYLVFAIYVCNIDYFLIQFCEETLPPCLLGGNAPDKNIKTLFSSENDTLLFGDVPDFSNYFVCFKW